MEPKTKRGIKKVQMGPTFSELVVKLAREIPSGQVSTYGAIAKAAGGGGMASRSVTGILAKAWNMGIHDIPWHRIVFAGGKVWIDGEHGAERMKLYKKEKIEVNEKGKILDFEDKLYHFR